MQREAAPSALAAARASQAATVTYDTLRAHGLHVPTLVDAAQPRARAARAGSDLIGSVVEETIQSEPELVKNAAGRWELRAPLPQSPPPPLKRPGAELAAALRTRLVRARAALKHVCTREYRRRPYTTCFVSVKRRWPLSLQRREAPSTFRAPWALLRRSATQRPLREHAYESAVWRSWPRRAPPELVRRRDDDRGRTAVLASPRAPRLRKASSAGLTVRRAPTW